MKLDDRHKIEDLIDELVSVKIENNKNTEITGNRIFTRDTINNIYLRTIDHFEDSEDDVSSRGASYLNSQPSELLTGKEKRVEKNVDIFSRFHFHHKDDSYKPTVRVYGLFSNLSSNRDKTVSYDDYNLLMLNEKSLLEEFVSMGFLVKVCISLDFEIIVNVWGYNVEQLKSRVNNLCDNLFSLQKLYKNLFVSFDTHNRLDSTFILGDSILIRAITASPREGYQTTLYEENMYIVSNAIRTFDDIFSSAHERDRIVRKQLGISSIKDYVETLIESRVKLSRKVK